MDTALLLQNHKDAVKTYLRKKRSDAGETREKYKSILPDRYRSYVSRANSCGFSFALSVADFDNIISMPCHYCGTTSKIGIDRIDSLGGYEEGNVVPCCTTCNMMKRTMSVDDFFSHIKRIYNKLKNDDEQD